MSDKSGKGKGGAPVVWPGSYGPDWYPDPLEHFPLQGKKDFRPPVFLRPYDRRKEEWPKCCHGDNCVVQVYHAGPEDGGRRFFRCPRGWNSDDEDSCSFTRWVDPPAIYPYQEYIHYLEGRIFDLEMNMSTPKEESSQQEEGQDVAMEEKPACGDPYCKCVCHGNMPPPPPPPPPPSYGENWYYGQGSSQWSSQQSMFSGCQSD